MNQLKSIFSIKKIYSFIFYGKSRSFIVSDRKKVVYIVVPKTGCSSIKSSFTDGTENESLPMHKQISRKFHKIYLNRQQKNYFKFSFVRNPFDRVVSCYVHKIEKNENALRGLYLPGIRIKNNETFTSFIHKVSLIPDLFADGHFQSQYSILHRYGKPLYDTLGKFENLIDDFEPIRKTYNLLPLPHIHNMKKGDWREYYTSRELVDMVYNRYKKDIETFGYQDEYQSLLEYVSTK
jgi:hypothetical protein